MFCRSFLIPKNYDSMNLFPILEALYFILLLLVILRVLYDTRSGSKTLAYILLIVLVPLLGMLFYFSFGINYRKRKMYSKKIIKDEVLRRSINTRLHDYSQQVLHSGLLAEQHHNLALFIRNSINSPITGNNSVQLLLNGEAKFPALLEALEGAKHHIHLEYYIYEDDDTGNAIADILMEKARQGVEVRFLYDDFGSHGLGRRWIKKLDEAGVETAPFYKIKLYALANRLNYRNHRKIVVIDGVKTFVGGINISDRYRNDAKTANDLYWRDTHLMIHGPGAWFLQHLFVSDWNFCSQKQLAFAPAYFPHESGPGRISHDLVQIASSGPDSSLPVIAHAHLLAICSARERILITTPYFIPGENLMDALMIAAKSGVEVKLLIPGISDSRIVNAAARSYYSELLPHGVRIFTYEKGFVHAKTMTIDDDLSVVGSSNMDYRSFELNFEVDAVIYGKEFTGRLQKAFYDDLKHATEIAAEEWLNRPRYINLWEKLIRLLSPFL